MRRIVVVGYGMAGHHLVARLVQAHGDFSVTVLGAETGAPYNRVLLPEVLAGRIGARRIDVAEPDDPRVAVRAAVRATRIDRERQVVHGDDGSVVPYDELVLATGANPVLPPLGGVRDERGLRPGVHTLRSLADLERLEEQLADLGPDADAGTPGSEGSGGRRRAVVVGGGLLGVQCARGLTLRGLEVDLIHQGPHLLDHRLDADAASVLARTVRGLGIEVHLECRARAVIHDDGRLTGVQLADGFRLTADLVLLACGSAPATGLAARAGLAVREGILVDERLTSVTDPRIHAIGDCARTEHGWLPGAHGLAAPALEQAEVLAARLLGSSVVYEGTSTVARLTATGVDIAILTAAAANTAAVNTTAATNPHTTRRLTDPAAARHRAVTVHAGRVVSSVLIGDVSAAPRLRPADRPVAGRCRKVRLTCCSTPRKGTGFAVDANAMEDTDGVRRIVVAGYGMVGHRCAELLAERAARSAAPVRITVLGEEPRAAYDRVHLSSLFDGKSPEELAYPAPPGVDVRLGEPVTAIDRARRVVTTAPGAEYAYDELVLATGSYPFVPPVPGHDATGCFVYRTIDDVEAIRRYAAGRNGRRGGRRRAARAGGGRALRASASRPRGGVRAAPDAACRWTRAAGRRCCARDRGARRDRAHRRAPRPSRSRDDGAVSRAGAARDGGSALAGRPGRLRRRRPRP